MPQLCVSRPAFLPTIKYIAIYCLAFCSCASAQVSYPILEAHVSDLPILQARTKKRADVLATSLDTILHDREVCCGKDSALEDSAERADPASLQDVAAKLQGRHLLSDGRPLMVTAKYVARDDINGALLIAALQQKHAVLMSWQSHLYVCYGLTYRLDFNADGGAMNTILTFLLLDTRYSDERREVVFNRQTDDWAKVQGVLWVDSVPQ